MIERVYLDSSVIGGCYDDEFAEWSNALMQDFRAGQFKPILSETVEVEIATAPGIVRDRLAELLALDHEMLPVTETALGLAAVYIDRGILTAKFNADGLT